MENTDKKNILIASQKDYFVAIDDCDTVSSIYALNKADYMISLNKEKEETRFKKFCRVFANFFRRIFGFKEKEGTVVKMNVLKNRNGKSGTINFQLGFNNNITNNYKND